MSRDLGLQGFLLPIAKTATTKLHQCNAVTIRLAGQVAIMALRTIVQFIELQQITQSPD